MDMSTIGRVAAGVAIGGAAIGAGIWAADQNAERTKRITLERGRTNYWDATGIPGGIPDVTGIAAGAAALGAAALVARGSLTGRNAILALPAAAALGAVTGFMVGRRVGEYQATHSDQWDAAVARLEDRREAKRDAYEAQDEAERQATALKEFHAEWGADDDATDLSFEDAAKHVMSGYDHNDDDSIDLRAGQPMASDERVADDHGGWRGGAWGPVSDPGSQVETLLPWFSGADADKDQLASLTEVGAHLRERMDANGNDRLDVGEGEVPQGREIDDYEDFAGS
jgi:hypothetical protein